MTIAVDLGRKATKQTNKQIINVYFGADPDEAFHLNLNSLYCLSKYTVFGVTCINRLNPGSLRKWLLREAIHGITCVFILSTVINPLMHQSLQML